MNEMKNYEKLRELRIQENKLKMKELGIESMAYERSQLKKSSKASRNGKMQTKTTVDELDEYIPSQEENHSSEEDNSDTRTNILKLRSHSKKVMAGKEKSHAKLKEKTNDSTLSMADQVKVRRQNTKNQSVEQGLQRSAFTQSKQNVDVFASVNSEEGLSKTTSHKKSIHNQQEKEKLEHASNKSKKCQSKAMLAPGSLAAYMKMKAREKQNDVLMQQQSTSRLNIVQALEHEKANSHMSFSQTDRFQPASEEDYVESEHDMDDDDVDDDYMDNDAEHNNDDIQDGRGSSSALSKGKRTRGPTMCKDVYEWTLDDRKVIILNEMGKPIGPDKKTLDKYSRFLGTLARNPNLAPLNKVNWHKVANKDNIWNIVKTKFIITEEGKAYALRTVGKLWRRHKFIVKQKHYKAYDDDDERKTNAPDTIPEKHFKQLLEYWSLDFIEEESNKNRENSINQKDRHTMGPMSFARKEHELQQQDNEKKRPSQAQLYKDSRKRKVGRNYKTSYEPIKNNIDKMEEIQMQRQIDGDRAYNEVMVLDNVKNQRQLGKCSTLKGKSKETSVNGVIIPDEFLKPYKDQIVKDTVGEVMKMFKQQLPHETFSTIARSIVDSSCDLGNSEFPSKETNGQEHEEDEDNGLELCDGVMGNMLQN